ncbi:hypothetical protein MTR67_030434 [Solanum verrucosum]|uniref:Uncharacterized protein n=1 Tax=Solanum verrucosum TaxID=315347 RepID=A0AAF0R602_SOLVR|nr:hypothetical protein MTR67_030434 [Solanum verrucosum]
MTQRLREKRSRDGVSSAAKHRTRGECSAIERKGSGLASKGESTRSNDNDTSSSAATRDGTSASKVVTRETTTNQRMLNQHSEPVIPFSYLCRTNILEAHVQVLSLLKKEYTPEDRQDLVKMVSMQDLEAKLDKLL